MKVKYFSIKDVKANEFGDLVYAKNDEVAKRLFGMMCSKNPMIAGDVQLCEIGEFDTETGSFCASVPKVIVDNVVESEN